MTNLQEKPEGGKRTTVDQCQLIALGKIQNRAGNITIVEGNHDVPFDIKRVYYLYDIPGGQERGGHAHYDLYQLIVSGSGSFEVELNDGVQTKTIVLRQPDCGLLIVPGIWRELKNFSSGSICLVLASRNYDEQDYIREFKVFEIYKKGH